jgi:hypothetical protein
MHVKRNIVAGTCNRCFNGKAVRMCEYVFVALGTQRETRTRHFVICDLSGSATLLHIIP